MLERILDFMLGPKSPLVKAGESRINMNGGYVPANFNALMKVVTAMVSDSALLKEFPMSENCKKMLEN
jgi:hypothetical protein